MLFIKELKKVVFSITFIVFVVASIAFLTSQDAMNFSDMKLSPPQQGMDYGMQSKEVPELIMPAAFESLYNEFMDNNYVAYPIGFYKNVKLNSKKQEQMAKIISALSGVSVNKNTFENTDNIRLTLKDDITYETFKKYMQQADKLIGGGSRYNEVFLLDFGQVPITFEEAQEQYNLAANTDRFTGIFARLFCDFFGIIISILPVFIAVALCLKDNRARINDLIYARKTSSISIVFTRYSAILAAVMLYSVILAYISNISMWGLYDGAALDYFAPLKYAVGWLTPSAMISIAVGMLFTELTGTPIAIAIQGIWWFIEINASVAKLSGQQSLFQLIPRHNSYVNTQIFIDNFNTLAANRLLFAGAALTLVFITAIIYEQKRRGKINGFGKITKFITNPSNSKDKSET